MFQRAVAVCVCSIGVLLTGAGLEAQAPNPTQQTITTPDGQMPVFRVTVVGRSVPAVNYRPRDGDTRINFEGTALLPDAKGWAEVEGERGYIKIDARFDDLEPAGRFGREYLTYVLWAITPQGRATNLGELQVNGDDGRLEVTTELQSFALIVTAEPYFAVSHPSDVVVIENAVRRTGFEATQGRVETVEASYELLKRGTYLMNRDPSSVKLDTPKPGERSDLAQARNAVAFARLAGADRYAADTLAKAVTLLQEAEGARGGNRVMQPARQAAQTAEDARLIALQRQEDEFQAQQQRLAEQREADARERAQLEEERRRQADQDRLRAEDLRLLAERERAQSDAARLAAERERLDAERAKADADRARLDAERVRQEADAARAAADAARLAAEQQARQSQDATAQAEREREELRNRLREQLNVILETRETARGLIVNVSDVLFDFDRAELKPGARERLARVAGILSAHPGLQIEIEGHTDAVGTDDYNQRLSERRAGSVSAYLREQAIGQAIVATAGFGESKPVATNGTAEGRQQNRRVEIVVSGEAIGR
jgi:outer membrane protein OmpA-like peptidoglycan-associated protein